MLNSGECNSPLSKGVHRTPLFVLQIVVYRGVIMRFTRANAIRPYKMAVIYNTGANHYKYDVIVTDNYNFIYIKPHGRIAFARINPYQHKPSAVAAHKTQNFHPRHILNSYNSY